MGGTHRSSSGATTRDGIYPSGAAPSAPELMLKAARTPRSSPLSVLWRHKPVPSMLVALEEAWPGRGEGSLLGCFSPQGSCFPSIPGPQMPAALPIPT